MQSFDIYFLGESLPGADPVAVRRGVAKLFKVQEASVERLFSGQPLRVKQSVDADAASRYRAAFREVGALIQIIPSGSAPPAARPRPMQVPAADPSIDATTESETPPDLSPHVTDDGMDAPAGGQKRGVDFGLAEPGAILDHATPPPPAQIDTSGLQALPPNTGSLEDCRNEKPHRPIPDISHLRLVDD